MVALSDPSKGGICVLVLGYGVIGRALVSALRAEGSIALVNVADPNVDDAFQVDVLTEPNLIQNYHYVINTIPIHTPELLVPLIISCIKNGVHYLDTNEDVAVGRFIKMLCKGQDDILFAPHCGLAPGTINVMGAFMHRKMGCNEIDMRVGALTRMVDNEYLYTPTWSSVGMVNQSLNDFDVIENRRAKSYPSVFSRDDDVPMGHFKGFYDRFNLDGIWYECFPTSGGIGTMTEMSEIKSLTYRTIRLAGHADAFRSLLHSYRFDRPSISKTLDEHRLSSVEDFVLVVLRSYDQDQRHMWIMKAECGDYFGIPMMAIQKCTVAGVAAILQLHIAGKIPNGFLNQHDVDWYDYYRSSFIQAVAYKGGRYGW